MNLKIVEGDLLDQDVDVIVNAWNRNIIPWWLLLPQGVSGGHQDAGRGMATLKEALGAVDFDGQVRIVRYRKRA